MQENESYVYDLTKKLEYSKDGDFVETGSIIFDPPSMLVFDEASDFEQIIMGAMISASKASGKQPDEEDEDQIKSLSQMEIPSASEIKVILNVSQDIKIRDIAKVFRKLAKKTGKLDNNIKLKDSHFDKMTRDDFMNMLCGYASFFTFPSLLGGEQQEENGSQ
jgi:hypothetical protein